MLFAESLVGVEVLEPPSRADVEVRRAQYDSRRVQPGDVFVAMRGGTTDGNRFVPAALARGAAAIVTDTREVWASGAPVPVALVSEGRRALATIAANLLDHPERKLKISAVTGTNGKTTTAFLLEQLLRAVGRKCVLIGTIETHIAGEILPSEHTTPESSDLLQIFADGVAAGCTEAVMEMSSHALDQERVWGVPVDVAIFTNLTQDHLDYHGTMEAYASAKMRLFAGVGAPAPRVSVVNADDPLGRDFVQNAARSGSQTCTYSAQSLHPVPDFAASSIRMSASGTSFTLTTPSGTRELHSPLVGRVNVYNLLAAMQAALHRHVSLDAICESVTRLRPVPGRFEAVPNEHGFAVVVDYAHTDDALRNLIALARELVSPHAGKVITLFGCGGDRDRTKRPKMGRAAGEGSDLIVLTSDNPRSEVPLDIIEEVLAGVWEKACECIVEPDRAAAIALAIGRARRGDIVLLAGKGHEKVQIAGGVELPFDDVAFAEDSLSKLVD